MAHYLLTVVSFLSVRAWLLKSFADRTIVARQECSQLSWEEITIYLRALQWLSGVAVMVMSGAGKEYFLEEKNGAFVHFFYGFENFSVVLIKVPCKIT